MNRRGFLASILAAAAAPAIVRADALMRIVPLDHAVLTLETIEQMRDALVQFHAPMRGDRYVLAVDHSTLGDLTAVIGARMRDSVDIVLMDAFGSVKPDTLVLTSLSGVSARRLRGLS